MKETIQPKQPQEISHIRFERYPYIRDIENNGVTETIDCSKTLEKLAASTGYLEEIPSKIRESENQLLPIIAGQARVYADIDKKLKRRKNLSFDDSYRLATLVCMGTNKCLFEEISKRTETLYEEKGQKIEDYDRVSQQHASLRSTALLSAMSIKEIYSGLTKEEISGMVAATLHLDTVARIEFPESIVSFGGMGGDQGYSFEGKESKLFSVSTLSAVALSVDTPVHKHHSYPNTSKVAGQSAIENYGARSDFYTLEAFENILNETNLVMSSCHDTRTLHTLSHALRGETINHVIGPLSFTISAETPVQAMVGVNENIHPEIIIEAIKILDEKKYQRYGNSAVYFGTNRSNAEESLLNPSKYKHEHKEFVRIDEVAPPPFTTVAAFLVNGENEGSFTLYPQDFYTPEDLASISFADLNIINDEDAIIAANKQALEGNDNSFARYLAMTVGLGLFVRHCLQFEGALDHDERRINSEYLRECTRKALDIILSGEAKRKLDDYVASTQKYAGGKL